MSMPQPRYPPQLNSVGSIFYSAFDEQTFISRKIVETPSEASEHDAETSRASGEASSSSSETGSS